jgi:DNA-binding protein YbaB
MIPRRLAAQIAAEPDAHAIEDLLDAAFKDAMEDMASAETTLPLGRKRIPGETNS